MIYDLETLLSDIKSIMTSNLNTKLTSITNEKDDLIVLKPVSSSAYLEDMDDKFANYDPFILTYITNIDTEGIGYQTSKTVTVNVALVLSDDGLKGDILHRMLRYGRALEEIFEENWRNKGAVGTFKIESLPVLSFQRSDNSERYKVVGLNLITSFA